MDELFCEDWILYDKVYNTYNTKDATTNSHFPDILAESKQVRVFGTKQQIKELEKDFNIKDAYTFEIEKEGSFHYKAEDNIIIKQTLKDYKRIYLKRDKQPLIFRIK